MITKEVNEWIRKIERGMCSKEVALEEFARISVYLTKEEIKQILNRLQR